MNPVRLITALLMATAFCSCAAAQKAPGGKLIYCSYSETRVAGLGKSYCELIADPGTAPSVHVVLDRDCSYASERTATYEVDADAVRRMQEALANAKVYELDGYYVDEAMTGGTIYRIYMEYDSGEKVNAQWYGHDIKEEALASYGMIYRFFEPWRSKTEAIEVSDEPRP